METRQQGTTLFSGILVLIATLVVVQLSLLAAALEAALSRELDVLVPTMLASIGLFVLSGGLLLYGLSFDERLRRWGSRG